MSTGTTKHGLRSNLLSMNEMDKVVRINALQQVTNPIYVDKRAPTPDGVLSYEIFGTSVSERRARMAYIDLGGHYMHPLAANLLYAYDRRLSDLLFARKYYRFDKEKGDLIEDPENGRAGPEFLWEIWGKIKVKDKETVTTKEIQKFYERPREKLFITKWLLLPAFFRDLNTSSGTFTKSSNELNNWYASILSYVETLRRYSSVFQHTDSLTRARVNTLLVKIYKKLMIENLKGNPSKFGMLRRYLQGRNVNYSARMVITASNQNKSSYKDVQVKYAEAMLPLAYTISCFYPFVMYELKRFFDMEFIQGGKVPVQDRKTKEIVYKTFQDSFDENHLASLILRYLNSPGNRYDLIETPPDADGNVYNIMLTGRFGKENTTTTKPITLTELLYIVAIRATKGKHVMVSRYPLDNFNGQFTARVVVSSTVRTQPALIGQEVFPFFPLIEGNPENNFIDTMIFSNTYLKAMGGDFNGSESRSGNTMTNTAVNAQQAV